jgi:hypothetical protein
VHGGRYKKIPQTLAYHLSHLLTQRESERSSLIAREVEVIHDKHVPLPVLDRQPNAKGKSLNLQWKLNAVVARPWAMCFPTCVREAVQLALLSWVMIDWSVQ